MLLELLMWGEPHSSIRAEHDGSCYVFTYENELSFADPLPFREIEVDGHRVTAYPSPGAAPDIFVVRAPRGFEVTEALSVPEGEEGVILSCPMHLT
jgi:hypothetical protein